MKSVVCKVARWNVAFLSVKLDFTWSIANRSVVTLEIGSKYNVCHDLANSNLHVYSEQLLAS